MRKLSIAALVVALLALGASGTALWRTRDVETKHTTTTSHPDAGSSTTTTIPLVIIPSVAGQNAYKAGGDLEAVKLKFTVVMTPSVSVPTGRVVSQNPTAGTRVPAGTVVEITVSSGPA